MKEVIIQKVIFVLILGLISLVYQGCSEHVTEETKIVEPPIVIQYDFYHENFMNNGINYNDLVGEWKLINAKFECALGEYEHFENNFAIDENYKKMIFGENEVNKICFWNTPKFVNGIHETIQQDSIKEFSWIASNGADIFDVYVNYTNEILTLYYRTTEVLINEKYYEGNVFESYTK